MTEDRSHQQPLQADIAHALQLAAQAALDGGQEDEGRSSSIKSELTPFAVAREQAVVSRGQDGVGRSDLDGSLGDVDDVDDVSTKGRLARDSGDARFSGLTAAGALGTYMQGSLGTAGSRSSGGTTSGLSHHHSYGKSTGSFGMPSPARQSIEIVRPSMDRSQLEHTTYEDAGPATIIRDADGQEYLIQPIRESIDRGGQYAQSFRGGASLHSASLSGELRTESGHLPTSRPVSPHSRDLKVPVVSSGSTGEGLVREHMDGPPAAGRQQGSPVSDRLRHPSLASEMSRLSLARHSIDENRDYAACTRSSTPAEVSRSGASTAAGPNSDGAGNVGQMYLNSLRTSAPISVGVGVGGAGRYSLGDLYRPSRSARQSGSFAGSHGTASLDHMHDFLNQQSDALAEFMRYGERISSDSDWEIDIHDIHFGPRIGRGAYGEVFKCVYRETDVAVKLFVDQDVSEKVLDAFRKEVDILKKLRHPNILHFMGYCTVPPHMCIVTEYEHNGSLFKLLHRNKIQLDVSQKLRIALDVAIGMHYLHTSKPPIIHGDLKSPNLLLGDHLNVKICDFGLSRFRMASKLSAGSKLGTPEWTAPEVLQSSTNSEAGDVYSFGVVLWELFTGQVPWEEISAMQVVLMVGFHKSRLPIPKSAPKWAQDLIEACFKDAEERPSFYDIISKLRDVKTKIVDMQGVSRESGEGI